MSASNFAPLANIRFRIAKVIEAMTSEAASSHAGFRRLSLLDLAQAFLQAIKLRTNLREHYAL
jgi:hypothetical protein